MFTDSNDIKLNESDKIFMEHIDIIKGIYRNIIDLDDENIMVSIEKDRFTLGEIYHNNIESNMVKNVVSYKRKENMIYFHAIEKREDLLYFIKDFLADIRKAVRSYKIRII
jgi:hypothetical protein